MKELYDLREMLCKELKDYGKKDELSAGALSTIDTLAHAVKNLDKIIEASDDDGYSGRPWPDYRYSMGRGSYARGRNGMGRYSRDGGVVDELRSLMQDAPSESIRRDIQRIVEKMEQQ